jgi:hypothetical protein
VGNWLYLVAYRAAVRARAAAARRGRPLVLAVWLALIVVLGATRALTVAPGTPPYPIAIAVVAPLVVFLTALWLSAAFRSFVSDVSLPLITAVQAWRWAGFGFLALLAYGVLPGAFAWPAGLGDMAIGITAPWVALALVRRPAFATSPLFLAWNLFGILDLVVAVSNGAINQSLATGAPAEITVAPMALLPLVLVPAYLVPLFVVRALKPVSDDATAAQAHASVRTTRLQTCHAHSPGKKPSLAQLRKQAKERLNS